MTASVTYGRALRYAKGSARGLLHHHMGHSPAAKRAMVGLARRISVILHRMWVDGTSFRSEIQVPHMA